MAQHDVCIYPIIIMPHSDVTGPEVSRLTLENPGAQLTRVNSHFIRELIRGKFIIKYEQLTQLENIGQGMCTCSYMFKHCVRIKSHMRSISVLTGEFGIVYKARLGPQGTAGREVAVKTLKG